MKNIYATILCLLCCTVCSFPESPADALLLRNKILYPPDNIRDFIFQSIAPYEVVDGYYFRIIQFNDFPDSKQLEAIRQAGLLLNGYIPYHAYNCAIPATFNKSLLPGLGARAVIKWETNYKIHRDLAGAEPPFYSVRESGKADLVVHYQANLVTQRVRELFESSGFVVIRVVEMTHTATVRIPFEKLSELAILPFVYFIEPVAPPSIKDDTEGRSLHRSNAINNDYVTGRHYDGTGITVGLADDGEIGPHIDFQGRVTQHLSGLGGGHGDMTSGICAGAGNLISRIRGMGTGANLHVFDISGYPHIQDALNHYNNYGMVITSTSYSQGCNEYTSDTEFGDQLIHDYPHFELCFSAGNDGTGDCSYGAGSYWGNITGGYKVGKNVLACGNLNALDVLETSSSRGPAPDGRIKPDICANGIDQLSTDENNTYQVGGGTSAACPGIAGSLTQLYQAYKINTGNTDVPSALIKACVLNSAEDLGNPGPDYKHGWGRINNFRATTTLEEHRYFEDSVVQGQTRTHNISVPPGVRQFRVMLYWHDVAGSAATAKALVNDLDLTATDPGSANFLPWVLDPTPNPVNLDAPAVRRVDSLNNVEQVTIDSAIAGNYTVTIQGSQVPSGMQKYYVVYEFRTDSVYLTFPAGGEGFEPGTTEIIRWDAFGDSGDFALRYSTDNGSSWNVISNSVPGTQRYYTWSVPNTISDRARVEISRNGFSDTGDTSFTILGMPANLHVYFACPDSIGLAWNAVSGASGYTVSWLGPKYMDAVGTTSATSIVVPNTNPLNDYWFAVKALGPNGGPGPRADAIHKLPGLINCSLSLDGGIISVTEPSSRLLFDCQNIGNLPLSVELQNTGFNPIGNFNLNYSVNGNAPVSEVYTGTLTTGNTAVFSFTQGLSLPSSGIFHVTVWITLAGDQNVYNDTLAIDLEVRPGATAVLPLTESFDSFALCSNASDCGQTTCNLSNGWINFDNGTFDDIDWRVWHGGTPSSGTGPTADHTLGTAAGNYLYLESSGTCENNEAVLFSPCLDLTGISSSRLSFWYHMYGPNIGELHFDVISGSQVYADFISPRAGNQGNAWQKDSALLDLFAGQIINIRFRGITGAGYQSDIALDDINLQVISTGITAAPKEIELSVYPNPGSGIFTYSAGKMNGKNNFIQVKDLLGKVVYRQELSNVPTPQKGIIDLTGKAKGVYTVSVRSDDNTGQVKLINME